MKHIYIFLLVTFFSYSLSAQCIDDGHSQFENQGWFSCQTSIGPIPERGNVHWLMYDFGEAYVIDSLYLWNHNVWGETGMGVKQILIDYSTDLQNWTTAGPYTMEIATGSWKYSGSHGPALGNVLARYVLISVVSTWSDNAACAGIGEIRFSIGESVDVVEASLTSPLWSISPNPAFDKILVDLPKDIEIRDLSLYNAVGIKIADLILPVGFQLLFPIDNLNAGLYFISYQTSHSIQSKSFVKLD